VGGAGTKGNYRQQETECGGDEKIIIIKTGEPAGCVDGATWLARVWNIQGIVYKYHIYICVCVCVAKFSTMFI
jgi:hypothetical protein